MKALGLVVSEKKIFYVFPMTPPGQGPYGPPRFFLCFSHYMSMGANDPGAGPFLTTGA